MKTAEVIIYSTKTTASFIWEIIYFPFWWYSSGLLIFVRALIKFLANQQEMLGFLVWLKNLFTPMYGQTDFAGRLISFFMRIVQVIFRGVMMIFWFLIALFFLFFWIFSPVLVIYRIFILK